MIEITVIVRGGYAVGYESSEPVTIKVKDYDCEGTDEATLQTDKDGEEYQEYHL